ncbi:MAG: helix-turn-helix domain-containing protein [Proteobacteria bacterium]|nr:helix-turn-helix domain-containing protein [Pseudomonadota bacterium]MCL2306704.1 helix-turn-helix domain-containing protein [Pseudomonadota bacterium]
MSANRIAKKTAQDWHPADIIAALRKNGTTLRKLSLQQGYCGTTLNAVLRRDWPKAEQIVAEALRVRPETIWPERYARRSFSPQIVINPSLRCGSVRFQERRAA